MRTRAEMTANEVVGGCWYDNVFYKHVSRYRIDVKGDVHSVKRASNKSPQHGVRLIVEVKQ